MQNIEKTVPSVEKTDTFQQPSVPYTVWIEWVLVNTVALAIGYAVAEFLIQRLDDESGILIGIVVGSVVGIMQGIVVWQRLPFTFWWILSCVVGWAIGVMITWSITSMGGLAAMAFWDEYDFILMGGIVGLFLGHTQWFILRQQVYQAGWWIPVNFIGWMISIKLGVWMISSLDFDFEMDYHNFLVLEQAIEGSIAGMILGITTGSVLIWLLRFKPILVASQLPEGIRQFKGYDKSLRWISIAIISTLIICVVPSYLCGGFFDN